MVKTFKVLSALLAYPTEELKAAAPAFREILEAEGLVSGRELASLKTVIDEIMGGDLYDLQERYVLLFDRTRSLSLHIFEHVHGEGRDRGQAMVDLMDLYERHGLAIDARELPDYLPLFLEFLSTRPLDEARDLLGQPLHVLTALRERLRKRQSSYANLFYALEALARGTPAKAVVEALLAEPEDDPDDLEALDKIWEEEAVTFGPGNAPDSGCPQAADMLNRMAADAPGPLERAASPAATNSGTNSGTN